MKALLSFLMLTGTATTGAYFIAAGAEAWQAAAFRLRGDCLALQLHHGCGRL